MQPALAKRPFDRRSLGWRDITEGSLLEHRRWGPTPIAATLFIDTHESAENSSRSRRDSGSQPESSTARYALVASRSATTLPTASRLDLAALRPWISRPQHVPTSPAACTASICEFPIPAGAAYRRRPGEFAEHVSLRRGDADVADGDQPRCGIADGCRCGAGITGGAAAYPPGALPDDRSPSSPVLTASDRTVVSTCIDSLSGVSSARTAGLLLGPFRSTSAKHMPMRTAACSSEARRGAGLTPGRTERPVEAAAPSASVAQPPSLQTQRPVTDPVASGASKKFCGCRSACRRAIFSGPTPGAFHGSVTRQAPALHPEVPQLFPGIVRRFCYWLGGIRPGRTGTHHPKNHLGCHGESSGRTGGMISICGAPTHGQRRNSTGMPGSLAPNQNQLLVQPISRRAGSASRVAGPDVWSHLNSRSAVHYKYL